MRALANFSKDSNDQFKPALTFGYYAELDKARDINDLHRRVSNIIKRLGFSDYSYIQLARADIYQPSLCTLSSSMMNHYYDNSLFMHDMNLQRAVNSREPFFRSEIHEYLANAPFSSDMTRCMEEIYELNKSYGYYDYYHVCLHSAASTDPVMLSVTQRGTSPIELKRYVKGSESALLLVCEAIDFVITKHFPSQRCTSTRSAMINPKPLRVLQTLANNDLTIEQVADKLCISVVTANQHLKTVRKVLGTKTNYAAIKRAVLEKLIVLEKMPDVPTK